MLNVFIRIHPLIMIIAALVGSLHSIPEVNLNKIATASTVSVREETCKAELNQAATMI